VSLEEAAEALVEDSSVRFLLFTVLPL
jgi:hypothetical protein